MRKIKKIWSWILEKGKKIWSCILEIDKKIPNAIITVAAIFMSIYFYICPKIPEIYVSEAIVGVAPFHVDDKDGLENKYLELLKPVNKYLRKQNSRHRLAVDIPERGGYAGVLDDLEEGNIEMAFVSAFSDAVKDNVRKRENIQTIGFLRKQNKGVYSYGIIYKEGGDFYKEKINKKDTIGLTKILKNYAENEKILLCNEELSTSTHVLPEIFLLKHDIDVRSKYKHGNLSRGAIKDFIKKNDYIAFFSNEDYERIENDTNTVKFYKINFPSIPYDAILVNLDWWKKLGKDTTKIMRALNNSSTGFEKVDTTNTRREREIFKMYMCSGIIQNDGTVILPDPRFDIYDLRRIRKLRKPDTVEIVSFKEWNKNTTMCSTLDTINKGTGLLIKKDREYCIELLSGEAKKGDHILPKK